MYCKNTTHSGVARTFGAHGQRTLQGPSPYFITLFLWPLPQIHPYSDFAHVYLYLYDFKYSTFNQYTSHGVFWKFVSLWWRDGGNGGPWWRNDKWDPLITWWEIRGHNGGPLMTNWWIGTPWYRDGKLEVIILMTRRKLGALDGAVENLGLFALWWRSEEIGNP